MTGEGEPLMPFQNILQQINAYFQQISVWFPGIPPSMLLFFTIVAGFLALALVLLVLRLLWAMIAAILGFKRRRRARHADPEWERLTRLKSLRQLHHWEREDYW